MAAKHLYRRGFLLLLFNFMSAAALERRFSDFKRCADNECSMLLCRGKAVNDFSGPDCRFLSFKKSETIYVYYKLSGRRLDLWAGSVGSQFGYFPKDLLAVNHIYTDKEHEVPAEETDFVCFDTGFDKFNTYDVDLLLGLSTEIDSENNTSVQIQAAEGIQEESGKEVAEIEKQTDHHENSEELHKVPDDQSASSPELEQSAEPPLTNVMESPDATERATEAEEVKQKHAPESVPENLSERSETQDTPSKSDVDSVPKDDFVSESEPVSSSEGVQIPELKTTIGSTFDAVITDEEITKKVTPYADEEGGVDVENHPEHATDVKEETPLLSFSKESMSTLASDSLKQPESPPVTPKDKQKTPEEKDMGTSLGDTIFSAVTEVDMAGQEVATEEEEDERVQIPKLETTFGTTFDAVVTDEEITKKVSPYVDEEGGVDVENHPEHATDLKEETPLLSFSKESMSTLASDSLKQPESPPVTPKDKQKTPEEKDMGTSLGDTIFSAVTEVDMAGQEVATEEEEDERVQIPKLETTFGTTFDAVVTDEEITKKVSPYVDEEGGVDVENHPEHATDLKEETPLLSFPKESVSTPVSDSLKQPESPPVTPEDQQKTPEEKDMGTSLGDTIFSAVTGVNMTEQEVTSEEEEDDDELVQIPKLKTTLGATFDAVVTDDEITKKVSPYSEEDSEDVEDHPKENTNIKEETPLLPFSEEFVTTTVSDSLKQPESPPAVPEAKPVTAEEKNMWTSIGDAVFSAVTGVDMAAQEVNSEEDEEEEEEEEEDEDQEEEDQQEEAAETHDESPSVESPKDLKNIEPVLQDPPNLTSDHVKENTSDSEKLLFDNNENDGVVIGHNEAQDETKNTADDPIQHQTEETVMSTDPVSQDNNLDNRDAELTHIKHTYEATEDKDEQELPKDSEVTEDTAAVPDSIVAVEQDLDDALDEKEHVTESEKHLNLSTEEKKSNDSDLKDDENVVNDSPPGQISDHLITDLGNNNSQAELPAEETETHEEPDTGEEESNEEELLEDENAFLFSQSDKPFPETSPPTVSPPEPEYSDSIMRLTLLRDHFTEEKMVQAQKLLGLNNLFKLETMFTDLDTEFQATRQSHIGSTQEIENALEGILETSENTILDEIEKMLESHNTNQDYNQHMGTSNLDEETEILDDFQELAFSLRQKYSTASDSTLLTPKIPSDTDKDEHELNVKEDAPHTVEFDKIPEAESNDNPTVTDPEEKPAEVEEEQLVLDEAPSRPDVSVEEDGGHFNKNKDSPQSFSTADEMQKVPQATHENGFDVGLGVEVENSPSGSMDSVEPVSEMQEEEMGLFSTGFVYTGCILAMMTSKTAEWTTVIISLLPEEWKPGETLLGCPWQAVVITALVGVMTFTLFFWRTVLAVKKREYLVDEKKLTEQIQAHKKEKDEALAKMAELQKQAEQLKQNQKQSTESVSCAMKRMQELESKVLEAETLNKQMCEEKDKYAQLLGEERANTFQNETRIEKLEKLNEKLLLNRKKIQEALTKTTILLDEAKIREDARNVQHKCLEKEFAALKEENKTLKATIKGWEEKHTELNEKIKVYQKSQKELEDSVVLKDHNVEVLSELLSDLEACDLQKSDTKVLANGEVAPVALTDKKTVIKNRIKQMMDISRVQTTLTVVEEERDRFMTKLLNEEKSRKALEEQHQELEHAISTLKSEKSHVENQFKILQQKNEIMVEMYQQKENALQQRLTKEELERRSKENLLSEVGGKALEAEEQVKILRQRINEMEEQMKKTEEVYKEQIKEQENKTHSNWVNARNAERALNQEKLESSKLREKLAVLTSQLNERRAPLFRPNSGQPAGPRQGDSYGPSPVSGGAPSPPIMIEGPRRPPSAPIARRIDPYGPRPPSDPHGRYVEKHISGIDLMGPRSSSPANLDASGPGSFIASPIRDSPGPMVHGLPPGPGPHDPVLPPGPPVRLPPPIPYRQPRPGPYHLPPGPPPLQGPPLPANGHPGMPLPGQMGGEFGPANGLAIPPRPGPGPVIDPRGLPPPHFRPPPPHHFGPMPPPQGVRGPMGPRPPVPPDMRFPGPRDFPLGAPSHPGNAYGQPAPDALQNSVGAQSVPRQDLHVKQEAPQDSARPTMVKP
ncbi:transport and Golgi organization protein 1 homolog isoform X2 [Archocentrus centrarchus]|uniref:transport and Golgi organization protein 1 homolog isoform X2 n=1 Tax=Archocentrus centrarchus TaxID=63155 RepID=UPI0011EA1957|nr:transport and Golgi organization protein 1 homolog isoform X2 [Archocentrus centrarchus]